MNFLGSIVCKKPGLLFLDIKLDMKMFYNGANLVK